MRKRFFKKSLKNEEMKLVKKAMLRLPKSVVPRKPLEDLKDRYIARVKEINGPACLMEYPWTDTHIEHFNSLIFCKVLKCNETGIVLYMIDNIDNIDDIFDTVEPFDTDVFAAFHPQYKYERVLIKERGKVIWMARLTLRKSSKYAQKLGLKKAA